MYTPYKVILVVSPRQNILLFKVPRRVGPSLSVSQAATSRAVTVRTVAGILPFKAKFFFLFNVNQVQSGSQLFVHDVRHILSLQFYCCCDRTSYSEQDVEFCV